MIILETRLFESHLNKNRLHAILAIDFLLKHNDIFVEMHHFELRVLSFDPSCVSYAKTICFICKLKYNYSFNCLLDEKYTKGSSIKTGLEKYFAILDFLSETKPKYKRDMYNDVFLRVIADPLFIAN